MACGPFQYGPEDIPADVLAGLRMTSAIIVTSSINAYNQYKMTEHLQLSEEVENEKTADEILPGSLKKSPSYNPSYGGNTRSELAEMAKQGDKAAGKMKKLVDNVPRLLDKIKNK